VDASVDASADAVNSEAGAVSDGASHDAAPLATEVLIFFGHSGTNSGILGAHVALKARYQAAGLPVTHTNVWPAALDPFRLVILVIPGKTNASDFFSTNEIAQLRAFLDAGNILYVENDTTSYSGTPVINDLLSKLGAVQRARDAVLASPQAKLTGLPAHPLLQGVGSLGVETCSAVDVGSSLCLGPLGGDCIVGVEAAGAGTIVVTGDVQILEDNQLMGTSDNRVFADRIARL
jgi:hypothetical protein